MNSLTDEQFEQLAAYLGEFTAGDPQFPVMTCINHLIRHARGLRELVAELATGLEDKALNDQVAEYLGDWE